MLIEIRLDGETVYRVKDLPREKQVPILRALTDTLDEQIKGKTTADKRKELEAAMYIRTPDIFALIQKELDWMEKVQANNFFGVAPWTVLDQFYDIWQRNKGKKGNKNTVDSWAAYSIGLTNQIPKDAFHIPLRKVYEHEGFVDASDMPF